MTLFPDLQEAIADAAHRHYGDRRWHRGRLSSRMRLSSLRLGPAIAAACLLCLAVGGAVLVLAQGNAAGPEVGAAGQSGTSVPESTVAASAALTHAPAVQPPGLDGTRPEPIADSDLERVAQELLARVPFPSSTAQNLGWLQAEGDMAQIDYRADLQALIEFRAGCEWLEFWLGAVATGDSLAASRTATILADIPKWPTNRGARTTASAQRWTEVSRLAGDGDVTAIRSVQRQLCTAHQ